MFYFDYLALTIVYLAPWLILLVLGLWGVGWLARSRRWGKTMGVAGLVLLVVVVGSVMNEDVSWRIMPALFNGYHYNPNTQPPDPKLILQPPETVVKRQLTILLGETLDLPHVEPSPLVDFRINTVHITRWTNKWLSAIVETTLILENGATVNFPVRLGTKGGTYINFPLIGDVNRHVYTWYAPESSLAPFIIDTSSATPLRTDNAPITLTPSGEFSTTNGTFSEDTHLIIASDIGVDGALLYDADLWKGGENVGTTLVHHTPNGTGTAVAQSFMPTTGKFSPDGGRMAYVLSKNSLFSSLVVVVDNAGINQTISNANWGTQHWVDDNTIAYSYRNWAYLYDLTTKETQSLVELPPRGFSSSRYFQVSPNGEMIAYVANFNELWVLDIKNGERHFLGWDVVANISWQQNSESLLFITQEHLNLNYDPYMLWVWQADTQQKKSLAHTGSPANSNLRFQSGCWVDKETILLTTYQSGIAATTTYLWAVATDGSGVWDVTPPNTPITYIETACANGYVAVNTEYTTLSLFAIER